MLIPLLPVCHKCPFAQLNQPGFKGGVCACTADPQGRDIVVMAKAGICPKGRFAGTVAQGIVGVAKALGHINRAGDDVIAERKRICGGCEKAVVTAGVFRRCSVCGCALALKILTVDEKCPIGRW